MTSPPNINNNVSSAAILPLSHYLVANSRNTTFPFLSFSSQFLINFFHLTFDWTQDRSQTLYSKCNGAWGVAWGRWLSCHERSLRPRQRSARRRLPSSSASNRLLPRWQRAPRPCRCSHRRRPSPLPLSSRSPPPRANRHQQQAV